MQPAQRTGVGEGGDVRLAEGDFGFGKGGIGFRFVEDGGGEFLRADQGVWGYALAEKRQRAFAERGIGEDLHAGRIQYLAVGVQ